MKVVIYTAIFGGYDRLQEPRVVPDGCDFVCFSDKKLRSKTWQVRVVEPEFDDPTRDARKYKILPHRYLGSYDISVWVDGNMVVRGDVNELIEAYLANVNMAAFSHMEARHRDRGETPNSKNCIYEEAGDLIAMHERGRVKDDPEVIRAQVERYRREGYPEHHGLVLSMVLLRRHNELDVIAAMEAWWDELKRGSKRDQISFNYVAWKHDFQFSYIPGNARNNPYFLHMPHRNK